MRMVKVKRMDERIVIKLRFSRLIDPFCSSFNNENSCPHSIIRYYSSFHILETFSHPNLFSLLEVGKAKETIWDVVVGWAEWTFVGDRKKRFRTIIFFTDVKSNSEKENGSWNGQNVWDIIYTSWKGWGRK